MPRRSPCHALGPIVALTLAVAACGDASLPVAPNSTSSAPPQFAKAPARPTGTGIGVISSRMDRTHQPVEYHGGRMMMSTTHVYLIWYGGWGTSITPSIVTDLVSSLGGSNYFQAVTLYRNPNGIGPSNSVQYAGAYYDSYSRGATISNIDVALIAASAVASGNLPPDPDGVYVVLPTADVNETSGFGTAYCGFHSLTNANGTTLQTLFVGHPGRVPSKCLPQMVSPNGDVGADAIASVLVAELFNTVTDPEFTAWYDKFLLEPADKCAWNFGRTYTTANGARANVRLGTRDYLLQQLWNPSGKGSCTLDVTAAS